MTVSGVNNANSNAGIYTTGAAVIGGGAGTAYGYLSRPFLTKDGVPTDSFVKRIMEESTTTPESRELFEKINRAKSIKEVKNAYVKLALDAVRNETTEKDISVSALNDEIGKRFDEMYAGKSFDEIRNSIINFDELKNSINKAFADYWDNTKKAFKDCEDDFGKTIKKTAQSIQLKHAAIYGAIGAAVLGLGTYLATKKKETSEA